LTGGGLTPAASFSQSVPSQLVEAARCRAAGLD